jgi:fructose-1,6-bisphosphatase
MNKRIEAIQESVLSSSLDADDRAEALAIAEERGRLAALEEEAVLATLLAASDPIDPSQYVGDGVRCWSLPPL